MEVAPSRLASKGLASHPDVQARRGNGVLDGLIAPPDLHALHRVAIRRRDGIGHGSKLRCGDEIGREDGHLGQSLYQLHATGRNEGAPAICVPDEWL